MSEQAAPAGPPDTTASSLVETAYASRGEVDLSWLEEAPYDDWALADEALRFSARLMQLSSPRHVVELGSGRSTRVLAQTAQAMASPPHVTTLENDPEVVGRTAAALEADGNRSRIEMHFAPVVVRRCQGFQVPVYHLFSGVRIAAAELVLVDGPPMPMGGRQGALYQAVGLAVEGGVILLDDANRDSEARALERLAAAIGDRVSIELLDGFDKGLAVVTVHEAVPVVMRIDAGGPRPAR